MSSKNTLKTKLIYNDILIFKGIIVLSVLSAMRSFFLPLVADEITYSELGEALLQGRYYLYGSPSTVTPVIPFLYAIFKVKTWPVLGHILHKICHLTLAVLGGRYVYLFLKQLQIDKTIIFALLALVAANPTAVAWFANLYPESILFFAFWGLMYYAVKPKQKSDIPKILVFFVVLVLTRYLYAVLGIIVLLVFSDYVKKDFKAYRLTIFKYTILFALPVLLWGKYILNVESNIKDKARISYFSRFQSKENPLLYNLKCGLGVKKHHEAGKINGVPAFASLFIPITGFRNYPLSLILLFAFAYGLILKVKLKEVKLLLVATLLPILGLVFAGTGFNRYWLVVLPSFCLGYYFLLSSFKMKTIHFVRLVQVLSLIYILNEIRLDILILNRVF